MSTNFNFIESIPAGARHLSIAALLLLALAGFLSGCSADPVELHPGSLVAEWSHDCTTVFCSNSGTDAFEPEDTASVDCEWRCAIYEGAPLHVKARFPMNADGCFADPIVSTSACEASS